jgi:membrane associated rhomboid family serine protease
MYSNQYSGRGGGSPMGGNMTPLVKKVLGILIILYVIQVFALKPQSITPGSDPIVPRGFTWLYLWDLNSGFWRPWQPLTAFLFNRGVFAAALDWLMVFFFLGSVEQLVGTKRLAKGMIWTAVVAILFAHVAMLLTGTLGPEPIGPSIAFRGLEPFLISLLVIFGLAQPNAQILLFFVLPIKAAWMAWVSGLLALLVFITSTTMSTALILGGWLGGYVFVRSGFGNAQRLFERYRLILKKKKLEKELSKFRVIEGGKDDDEYLH